MTEKTIKFQGKIKVREVPAAKTLLALLKYVSEDLGFTVKKFKSDEIKLIKNDSPGEPAGETANDSQTVEIEIEVSDTDFEVEIESENLETVKDLTSRIYSIL